MTNKPGTDPLEEVRQMRLKKLKACALRQKAEMEGMLQAAEQQQNAGTEDGASVTAGAEDNRRAD
ncbi:MAG: hypothetical protein KYX62_07215 [Pseudomonadota bacterium]|nr:hypothetical protein [Pseudomonadota bacterium]